jgi:hypothetical protein
LEKLNRALTYALDADKGGWDLTQVLRLPGTRNYKYPEAPMVKLMWVRTELTYDPSDVWRTLRETVGDHELTTALSVEIPRTGIPSAAKRLLRTPTEEIVEGERSHVLWKLECMLAEAGLGEEEIFDLVWPCGWNKWRGVNTGRERLRREVRKAIQHVARRLALRDTGDRDRPVSAGESVPDGHPRHQGDLGVSPPEEQVEEETGSLPWISYSSFMAMSMEEPKWLIEDIWVADSHGVIGGEPKTQKTTMALAMALAVASGSPMLGRYRVGKQGPVLMVQEENAPWMMQDRMRKLAAYMGLISTDDVHVRRTARGSLGRVAMELDFPVDLPLKLLNNFGFDLGVEEHRELLEAEVESLRPVLVILDPLYLVLGGANENQGHELRPFLRWLLALRYQYDCAVAVVHHTGKAPTDPKAVRRRPGQRLLGSTTLHGWADSGIYTSELEEERERWKRARVETEFRSMAPRDAFEMAIHFENPGSLLMDVEFKEYKPEDRIIEIVTQEPGVTVNQLAQKMGMDKRTILARCRGSEHVVVEGGKRGRGHSWKVYLNGSN